MRRVIAELARSQRRYPPITPVRPAFRFFGTAGRTTFARSMRRPKDEALRERR